MKILRQPPSSMGRKRQLSAAIALLASSSLLSSPSFADNTEVVPNKVEAKTSTFKKITVNATRMATDIDDVTRPIAVVSSETIESMQAQSTAEVLRYEPNVTIFGGPRANQQSINIRGLADEKVLQTIDGVRQDFNSGHRPRYFLDPALLKSVEVVKGPASSLWGSGALGGVVAQTSVSARDLLKPEQNFGGLVKSGYNFNNNQTTNTAAIAGRTSAIDWLVSGYFRDSDDLEQGNGQKLTDSSSRDAGALVKAEWQIDDAQSVGINIRRANVDGHIPNNGGAMASSSNFVVDRQQRTSTVALDYGINTASPLLNAKAKIYRNSVEMDESRVSDNRADSTEQETYGVQLSNQSDFGAFSMLYGIDGYREDFSARRSGANRPAPPEAITEVWGAFTQATIPLNAQWQVELGARYDDYSNKASNLGLERSENELSPSAALTYKVTKWLEMTLRHDRAFRAPTSEELYTTGTHFCMGPGFCNTFISNPNLRPESAENTELLAKMRFSNVFGNDELRIDASVFENNVDDFIEQVVIGPTFFPIADPGSTTFQNVDKAKLRGAEIAANYRLDALRAKLAYGQVRGKDDASGRSLSNIPADTLTADLSYGFNNEQLRAGVRITNASTQDRKPATDANTYSGYTTGDLYATWKPQALDALSVGINVNNVSDRYYRRAFSELYESGREVITSVRYDF